MYKSSAKYWVPTVEEVLEDVNVEQKKQLWEGEKQTQREPVKSPEFFSINGSTAKTRRVQQTFQPEII
jgi:hypothetical protein